ncbi:MAG: hypothetical protein A3D10_04170 [Omnitrophica WOR_2 bacterium RIFCSPHIGHO2_02_FULL_48_11]|nr:MAG: hypothetical protein A3D10_04170 [Omnitrophica WOR_2 bacterium RIFCSPHIGHO2_02_FULL_48_11]
MFIGQRIKQLREAQKMTLTELSEKSGVQLATLSRMENMKMTGTLESHIAIAQTLGIELTQLYRDLDKKEPKPDLRAARTASDVFSHNEKSSYEILTTNLMQKRMLPILLKIEPGGRTNKEQNIAGSEKFIFVLEGRLEIHVGSETYSLAKGNTLYFDAGMEHYFVNPGDKLLRAVCVLTPVSL